MAKNIAHCFSLPPRGRAYDSIGIVTIRFHLRVQQGLDLSDEDTMQECYQRQYDIYIRKLLQKLTGAEFC